MIDERKTVAQRWEEALREGGYETTSWNSESYERALRPSRVWRRLAHFLRLSDTAAMLEVVCGGGNQLIPLALRGHRVVGLDVSRARSCFGAKLTSEMLKRSLARPLGIETH